MKKLTNHQREKIAIAAELACYAMDWALSSEEGESAQAVAIESVGHMLACAVCQWVTKDSVGTGETIEFLGLDKRQLPLKHDLELRLLKYIETLQS